MLGDYQRSKIKIICFALILALLLTMAPLVSFANNGTEGENITDKVTFGNLQIYLNNELFWENGSMAGSEGLSLKKGDNVTLRGEWAISKEALATVSPGAYFLVELPDYFDFRSTINGEPLNVTISGKTVTIGEFSLVDINGKYALKVTINNLYYEHPKTGREIRISALTDGTFMATAYASKVTTEEPYYFTYGGMTLTGPAISDGYDWGINGEGDSQLKKVGTYEDGKYKWAISVNMQEYIKYLNSDSYKVASKPALLIEDNLEEQGDNRMVFDTSASINAKLPYYVINSDGTATDTKLRNYDISSQFTKVTKESETSYGAFVDKVKSVGEEKGAAYGFYDNWNFVMYIKSLPGDNFKTNLDLNGLKETMDEYLSDTKDSRWKHFTQSIYDKTLNSYKRFYNENNGNIIGFNFDLQTVITGAERDVDNYIHMSWYGGTKITEGDEMHYQGIDVTVKATNPGEIVITKLDTDRTGRPLSGAAFKLQYWDKSKNAFVDFESGSTTYTDSNGEAWFSPLESGRYKIIEISTIEGYDPTLQVKLYDKATSSYVNLKGPGKDEFDIDAGASEGLAFEAYNKRKTGSAKIIKVNEDNQKIPVAGAKFYLEDQIGNKVMSGGAVYYATTNASGEAVWTGLPWGKTYTVKEEGTAYGYGEKTLKFIGGDGTFTINSSDVETMKIIKATNKPLPGEMILVKKDKDSDLPISGAAFKLEKLVTSGGITTFEAIKTSDGAIREIVSDGDGVVRFGDLAWGTYRVVEVSPAEGYEPNSAVFTGGGGPKGNEFTIGAHKNSGETIKALIDCVNTPKYGSARLIKKDAETSSKFLSGASFYLKKDGNVFKTMEKGALTTYYAISNRDGVVEFNNLPWGNYEVFEYSGAYGYDKALIPEGSAKKTFTINSENAADTIELGTFLNNQGTGSFTMYKLSTGGGIDTNLPIEGAKFLLTHEDGTTYSAISDKDGRVYVSGLPWGKYTVTEVTPAKGYENDFYIPGKSFPYEFTINDAKGNMEHHWTAYDTRKTGRVDITKYDKETNAIITGVSFKLLLPNGQIYKDGSGKDVVAVTDSKGVASFENLPWGTYTVTESAFAEGYDTSSFTMANKTFTIGPDNAGTTLTYSAFNTKEKGSVEIEKLDSTSKAKVNGATFYLEKNGAAVKKDDGTTLTAIAGADGISGVAKFTGLDWGTYTVKELTPAKGYKAGSLKFVDADGNVITNGGTFTITEQQKTHKIKLTAENDRNLGKIKVIKKDSISGKELSGASFYLKKDGEVYKTTIGGIYTTDVAITGANGVAEFKNLPWGNYELVELAVPAGYRLDSFTVVEGKMFTVNAGNADETITLNAKNSKQNGVLKIKKIDGDVTTTIKAIEGAVFYLEKDGVPFNKPGTSNRYEVTTDALGEATFTDLPWGTYKIIEKTPAKGYQAGSLKFVDENRDVIPNGDTFKLDESNAAGTIYVTAENTRNLGQVKLLKKDTENNTVISGASFYLLDGDGNTYMADGTSTTTAISGPDGIAKFDNLPWGDYTVKELKAADGYKLNSFTMDKNGKFTVDSTNVDKVINLTADNVRYKGGVKIYKTDGTSGKNISGASFYLVDSNGKTVMKDDGTTLTAIAKDGVAEFTDLAWGTYTVKELSAAKGYENKLVFNDPGDGTFTIDGKNVNTEIKVFAKNNRIKGNAVIYKTDAEKPDKKISGASFYLLLDGKTYKEDGTTTTVAIAKNGKAEFKNLPWGNYEVKELSPAPGYKNKLNFVGGDGTFTLDDQKVQATVELHATNERELGKVKIYKTDATDDRNISGASFYLIHDGQTYMKDGKTTTEAIAKNGVAEFTGLPWGDYEVKELSPAAGYEAGSIDFTSSNGGKFTLDEFNVDKEVTVNATNKRIPGKIQIVKTDSTDDGVLKGAEFYLLKNGKTYMTTQEGIYTTATAVTDENGIAKFEDLPWDTYQVVELKPAAGYEPGSLKIEKDGKFTVNNLSAEGMIKFDATNDRILGEVEIEKLDATSTGTALKGAEFYLEKSDGTTYMTTQAGVYTTLAAITGDDGIAKFSDLPWDTYTVKELTPPQGYQPGSLTFTDGSNGTFTVDVNQQKNFKLTATNKRIPGEFLLEKVDGINSDYKLAGAEFYLEKLNEKTNAFEEVKINGNRLIGITDIYGMAKFTDLEWGTYRVIESKAPEGYDKDSLTFAGETNEFVVGAAEQYIAYTAYNTSDDVLGDEAFPHDGSVLGQEAKTGDYLDMAMLIGAMLVALMALVIAIIQLNRRRNY